CIVFFFFQVEDGIRDFHVTGVQTCALPISTMTSTMTEALKREVRGRIGVEVIVGAKLGEHLHEYTSYQVQLTMYSCKLPAEARPYPATVADLRWVTSREFLDYDFPPADEKTMSKLLGLVRNCGSSVASASAPSSTWPRRPAR